MTDFVRMLKQAAARRIAYLVIAAVLALAGSLWAGKASAQEVQYPDCFNPAVEGSDANYQPQCPNRQVAYAQALLSCQTRSGEECRVNSEIVNGEAGGVRFRTVSNTTTTWRWWSSQCPVGTEWFDALQACDKPCAQRNADLGTGDRSMGSKGWGMGEGDSCIAGCVYKLVSDRKSITALLSLAGGSPKQYVKVSGTWEYTGDRCAAGQPSKPKSEEKPKTECTPSSAEGAYCEKPNGERCMSASTGRTFCWQPNEEGKKTDGPNTQELKNGPLSPNAPQGSSHTSTTTVNNTTSNSTTTINNYTTNNGSPAGPSNQGQSADENGAPSGQSGGQQGGTGDDGEDDGNDDKAGGGSGCDDPPTSSGNALLGAIYRQAWETRCEIAKGHGSLKGEGQCNDGGVVAFACSGDSVGCQLALRARERGCREDYANQQLRDDAGKDTGSDGNQPSLWTSGDGLGQLNTGLISVGGGSDLVPTVTIEGQTIDLNGPVGNLVAILRMIIIAAASAAAAFIAGGRN